MDPKQTKALDSLVQNLDRQQDKPAISAPPDEEDPADLLEDKDGESDEATDENEAPEGDEAAPEAVDEKPAPSQAKLSALFDTDPDAALFQAFGKSADELGVDNADWVQIRRAGKRQRDKGKAIVAAGERLEQKFGPVFQALEAWQKGEVAAFADIVEQITGEPYESANVKILRAKGKDDPGVQVAQRKIAELQAKLSEYEPAEADTASLAEAVQKELGRQHPVRNLPEWDTAVALALEESADADGDPTITVKQAADAVFAEAKKKVDALQRRLHGKSESVTAPRAGATASAKRRKMSLDDLVSQLDKE